jgi:hypothetical protein
MIKSLDSRGPATVSIALAEMLELNQARLSPDGLWVGI